MKKKVLIPLIIIFSILAFLLYVYTSNNNDEKFIRSFLNEYFKQVDISDEEWAKITESDDAINKFISNSDYDKYLTKEELDRLTSNRELPCMYFKNLPDDFKYKILNVNKVSSDKYEVSIDFLGQTSFEVRLKDTQYGRRIEYVNFRDLIDKFPK